MVDAFRAKWPISQKHLILIHMEQMLYVCYDVYTPPSTCRRSCGGALPPPRGGVPPPTQAACQHGWNSTGPECMPGGRGCLHSYIHRSRYKGACGEGRNWESVPSVSAR